MNVTEWFLLVSILLNAAFLLGAPIVLFVRYLIRRTQWRIVGKGANGVDVRFGRPKNGYYLWKLGGGKAALVVIDGEMLDVDEQGRPVLWVDTDNMQQISPERKGQLTGVPKEYIEAVGGEMALLPTWRGRAVNDAEKTEILGLDGKKRTLSYLVWTRINGSRLYRTFRDIRIQQMNESNAGMWATIERLTPVLAIVAIIMLIVIMVQLGNMGA